MANLIQLPFLLIPIAVFHGFIHSYEIPKWLMIYLPTIICLISLLFTKSICVPSFNLKNIILFSLLMLFASLSMFFNSNGYYRNEIVDWLVFFSVVILSFNYSKKLELNISKILPYLYFSTLIIIFISLSSLAGFYPFSFMNNHVYWSRYSLFGNLNFLAEFLAISLIIQFYFLKKGFNWRNVFFSISLFAFCFCLSRSMSLALIFSFLVYLRRIDRFKLLNIVIPILAFFIIQYEMDSKTAPRELKAVSIKEDSKILKQKQSNIYSRLALNLNTLSMIKDNFFWGIGPNRFQFSYLPYSQSALKDKMVNDRLLAKSPHNAYLELLVEYGFFTFLIVMYFYFTFIKSIWRQENNDILVLKSLIVFFSINLIFNFPMQLPFPFFVAAFFIGIGLSKINNGTKVKRIHYGLIVIFIAISGATTFYKRFYSLYTLSYYPMDTNKLDIACDFDPSFWKACIHNAELLFTKKHYKRSIEIATNELIANPFNSAALRILALSYFQTGENDKACHIGKMYESFFNKETELGNYIKLRCF